MRRSEKPVTLSVSTAAFEKAIRKAIRELRNMQLRAGEADAAHRRLARSLAAPTIIDLDVWWDLPESTRQVAELLLEAHGQSVEDCFRIVIGRRSIWYWIMERTPSGSRYLDEQGRIAYRVERVDR